LLSLKAFSKIKLRSDMVLTPHPGEAA